MTTLKSLPERVSESELNQNPPVPLYLKIGYMSQNSFPYDLDFEKTDFRKHPELYRIGRGEQGVLLVQPYKSEILPHWRFKNPEIAQASAEKIYAMFENYLEKKEFVGADMARKYLQMGFTRARRYANHASGKKYKDSTYSISHFIPLQSKTQETKI